MKKGLIALAALFYAVPAMANFTCEGSVTFLGVGKDGTVYVNNGYGVWAICNLSTITGGITPEACAGWYSGLLTANAGMKDVRLYFVEAENSGIATCSALGDWAARIPYFLDFP